MRSTRESAVGLIDEGIDFQIDTASIARLVGQVSNFLELDFWGVSEGFTCPVSATWRLQTALQLRPTSVQYQSIDALGHFSRRNYGYGFEGLCIDRRH
jgi:hypothetical protein